MRLRSMAIICSILLLGFPLSSGAFGISAPGSGRIARGTSTINMAEVFQAPLAHQIFLPFVSQPERRTQRVFDVTSKADKVDIAVGNGICETGPGNGECTLRAAIQEANNLTNVDVVINVPAGAYTLTIPGGSALAGNIYPSASSPDGDLDLSGNITIRGAGASGTFIQGRDGLNERVLDVFAEATVNISGITIRSGRAILAAGGGIDNKGTLTISDSVISNNLATRSRELVGGDGGGIRNRGKLTILNSTIHNNESFDDGGGISNNGTMMLVNVTLSGNRASGQFDDNGVGGAIANQNSATTTANATIINSTIANNTAVRNGGGIRNSATLSIKNTIVANNTAASSTNCSGTILSGGNNLEGGDTCKLRSSGDRVHANAQLGVLTLNGGFTPTLALQPGSAAIDAANSADCPATDQRGFQRPADGDGNGTRICDIGAFELGASAP